MLCANMTLGSQSVLSPLCNTDAQKYGIAEESSMVRMEVTLRCSDDDDQTGVGCPSSAS